MTNGKKCLNMLNSKTDMEWIDGFLRQELSESEVATFQERLAKEPAFAALFEEQELILNGIRLHQLSDKVRHFQQMGQEMDGNLLDDGTIGEAVRYDRSSAVLERFREKGKEMDEKEELQQATKRGLISYIFSRYAAAAAVLLFLVSFWWANEYYSSQAIAKNSIEFPLSNESMKNPSKGNFNLGKKAFFNKDYEKALKILEEVPLENNDYFEAQVLLAYNLFEMKKYDESINQFNQLIDKDFESLPNIYKNENKLRWNRLVAYVGKNNLLSPIFQQELEFFLNSKSDFYRNKAIKLNKELNSTWRLIVIN